MNHVSLFSGIGGFDLAAHVAGFKNCACVEIDPWCRNILKMRFPDTDIYEDVTTVKSEDLLKSAEGHITVMSGGFPCQPISVCGHRKGSEDTRWMWNDYARIIRETHPDWIIIENSPRLLIIPEWGGVQNDLEEAGYEIQCFRVSASGVGAPHVRERACIVAHTNCESGLQTSETVDTFRRKWEAWKVISGRIKSVRQVPSDSFSNGLQENLCEQCGDTERKSCCICCNTIGESSDTTLQGPRYSETMSIGTPRWDTKRKKSWCRDRRSYELPDWEAYPSEICRMDDGIPPRLDKPRLQALGNAIVPRVFYPFLQAIRTIEEL